MWIFICSVLSYEKNFLSWQAQEGGVCFQKTETNVCLITEYKTFKDYGYSENLTITNNNPYSTIGR